MGGRRFAWLVVAFYAGMALVGLGVIAASGRWRAALAPAEAMVAARGAAWGAAVAAAVVLASAGAARAFARVRALEAYFAELLGPLAAGEVLLAAAASAVGEELLFRAALQPLLGLVGASLLFGLLHLPGERRLVPWTGFAVVMGFALGALYERTGTLAAPVVAHFGINLVNLWRICGRGNGRWLSQNPRCL
ncbi:MAG: CPBP family intramembrane metalloprotease [Planctomycetes bacterium]|nr:CPBP family intramembrane metalloprotease [Planctomycetota bacterium]